MSFQIALSGLDASRTDLEVTSNNIANSRTTGFKEARTEFGDVFATSLNDSAATAAGRGVKVTRIAQQFSQGTVDFTSRNLDLAINGDGFFILDGDAGVSYTRAGAFSSDKDGYIVDHKGDQLQVYQPVTDADGTVQEDSEGNAVFGDLGSLQLPLSVSEPKATEDMTTSVNLDAGADAPTIAFDRGIAASYNFSTSSTVYDSQGEMHTATFYYDKDYSTSLAEVTGSVVTGSNPIINMVIYDENSNPHTLPIEFTETGAGTNIWTPTVDVTTDPNISSVTFSGNVDLSDTVGDDDPPDTLSINMTLTYSAAYLASNNLSSANQVVAVSTAGLDGDAGTTLAAQATDTFNKWKVYTFIDNTEVTPAANTLVFSKSGSIIEPVTEQMVTDPFSPLADPDATSQPEDIILTVDLSQMTQYGGDFAVSNIRQDGYATGRLSGLDIDAEGVVFSRYTNGQAKALGKVALAKFDSPQNLTKLGDTSWAQSFASGEPVRGYAGTAGFGDIQSGALEASNVDLAEQLVNLIVAQRTFQANSKVITSSDQILQTIIQI